MVAERETRQTNVVVLKVDHADAPGLKPGKPATQPRQNEAGGVHFPNAPMAVLVSYLENRLRLPVLDQTGLTGTYDIQIPTIPPGQAADRVERLRTTFLDQLGLNLITTNATIEMLVIKKANQTP